MSAVHPIDEPFVVLLVEDDEMDATLIKYALEENRIPVDLRRAHNGAEAIEFLRRAAPCFADAPCPGLIVLDLNMPHMGGMECLAVIKRDPLLCDIPAVVLSSSRDEAEIAASLDLGAADFFTKPMDAGRFVETIRILGERWISPGLPQPEGERRMT